MNVLRFRQSALALVIGMITFLSSGCAVVGDGYGYNDSVSVGIGLWPDYYEPYGSYYGGWGPGYRVGPSRGGSFHPDRGAGRPMPRAYRPAPASRPMPSIPGHPRPHAGNGRPR
jgi:hypothetical protein